MGHLAIEWLPKGGKEAPNWRPHFTPMSPQPCILRRKLSFQEKAQKSDNGDASPPPGEEIHTQGLPNGAQSHPP